jgi:hypothetical protein
MVLERLVRVRAFAAGGAELADLSVDFEHVTDDAQLPPNWLDRNGPWWDDVALARSYFPALGRQDGWGQFLVHTKLPQPALNVEIGVAPLEVALEQFGMTPPAFFLAVVDALAEQEVTRVDTDNQQADDDRQGLEDALGNRQVAMLLPNAQYEVVVLYSGNVGAESENSASNEIVPFVGEASNKTNQEARRTFFTDREPPRSLDPWMLAQFPSPGEQYHFYGDPVVVVFATDNVLEMYAAYRKELRAVARAASFRGSAGTPEAPLTHLVLTGLFRRIGGAVLSPWEATVRRRMGALSCGAFDPDADRHGSVTLPFALDPLTDYVMDLEMLNPDGSLSPVPVLPGEVGSRPLYRQAFTTSRYATRAAFAESVRTTLVNDVLARSPAPLAALAERVTDEVFDLALLDAGFTVTGRPDAPAVSVLWTAETPAQPFAVFLETPEPVWRTRREPKARYDETGEYILEWTLTEQVWLFVDELVRENPIVLVTAGGEFIRRATGTKTTSALTLPEFRRRFTGPKPAPPPPVPAPPAALVSRFVRDASGTRTLAVLSPGARGKTLSLGLARNLHPLLDADATDTPVVLCEVELLAAPWEEPV